MDKEGRPERSASIGNPAKPQAGNDTGKRFNLRFSQMEQYKRNHLYNDTCFAESFFQTKEQKTSE